MSLILCYANLVRAHTWSLVVRDAINDAVDRVVILQEAGSEVSMSGVQSRYLDDVQMSLLSMPKWLHA